MVSSGASNGARTPNLQMMRSVFDHCNKFTVDSCYGNPQSLFIPANCFGLDDINFVLQLHTPTCLGLLG